MNDSRLSIVQVLMDVDMISKVQTYTDNRTVQEFIEEQNEKEQTMLIGFHGEKKSYAAKVSSTLLSVPDNAHN